MFASLAAPKAAEKSPAGKERAAPKEPDAAAEKKAPPSFTVASFALQKGRVHFRENHRMVRAIRDFGAP